MKNNSDICMCRSATEMGENTENKPQMSSKLIWLCLSSVPLPLSRTQVIVQCNHITAHLNIHNRHKDLEEKWGGKGR